MPFPLSKRSRVRLGYGPDVAYAITLLRMTNAFAAKGDYVVCGLGLEHSCQAETDAVVMTARWPSLA